MEIHAPQHPILTWKEFLVHLSLVTVGILIALSLENLVECNHKRELVHEARENIANEIRDNQRDLSNLLNEIPARQKDQQNTLQLLSKVKRQEKLSDASMNFKWTSPDLSDSSWKTAQQTGALALMSYKEVKSYSEVYRLQERFSSLDDEAFETLSAASARLQKPGFDPNKLSPEEVKAVEDGVLDLVGRGILQRQIGEQLRARYTKHLGHEASAVH